MSAWALLSLVNAVVAFLLAAFVYFFDKRNPVNRSFALLCLFLGAWAYVESMYRQAESAERAALWLKAVSFWPFVPALLFDFCLQFTGYIPPKRLVWVRTALYLPASAFSVAGFTTPLILKGPILRWWGYAGIPNPEAWLYWVVHGWAYLLGFGSFVLCLIASRTASDPKRRQKAFYVTLSLSVPLALSFLSEVVFPLSRIPIPELSTTSFSWLAILIVYAIWRFELFTVDPSRAAQQIVETMADALFLCDPTGRISFVNAAGCRMTGFGRSEIEGRPVSDFLQWEPPSSVPENHVSGVLTSRSGASLPVEVSTSPIVDHANHVAGYLYLAHDLSSRLAYEKRLEQMMTELQRSNRELEQFAYLTSHDLQEPLRMVASFVSLLEKRYGDRLDERAREYIRMARDGSERMHRLIQDLLAYSRISTRAKKPEPVSSVKALEGALRSLSIAIAESGAVISHNGLPTVVIDPSQLERLFQNLIANAIKFRGTDPPRITISAERHDATWLFRVRDNGIGIPEDAHERIFGIFQRLHGGPDYPGTGIGLAIARKIVEQHGGRIWVESQPGSGSTFCFTLPAEAPPASGVPR